MDRMIAVGRIAQAAHRAWERAPQRSTDKSVLHFLAWAERNAKEKGTDYTAGHFAGISAMTAHGVQVANPIGSALFFVSEALTYDGEVPEDQINACIQALDGLFVPEAAHG